MGEQQGGHGEGPKKGARRDSAARRGGHPYGKGGPTTGPLGLGIPGRPVGRPVTGSQRSPRFGGLEPPRRLGAVAR